MGARTICGCHVFLNHASISIILCSYYNTSLPLVRWQHGKLRCELFPKFSLDAFSRLLNFLRLVTHSRYHCPGQSGKLTSPKQVSSAPLCRPSLLQTLWKCWSCCGSGEFSRSSTQKILSFDIYRLINTILFLLTLKFCPPLVPNLHEVGFTVCSFLDPTGDFSEMVGLYVTMEQIQVLYFGCEKQRTSAADVM